MTDARRFRQSAVTRSLALAFGATASLLAGQGAWAQTAPSGQSLQRVEITGTNIRRAEAETASPVQTVTREEIDRSGKTTVAEYLQTLTADNAGSVPMSFGNGFAKGASGISLRGLGTNATLVLINGRRIAPYGLADDGSKIFADLNVMPLEAVDRIEVLKDGASAIYGSDAIAGVVNVILRRSFVGTVAKATGGTSKYKDGNDYRASITHGFGSMETEQYNVLFNLELGKKEAIYSRDRRDRAPYISRSDGRPFGFSATSPAGNGQTGGGTGAITGGGAAGGSSVVGNVRNPTNNLFYPRSSPGGPGVTRTFPGANCANFSTLPADPGGGCVIDATNQYLQVQPSEDSINFFARGARRVSSELETYVEASIVRSESRTQTTPSGVNGAGPYPGPPISNAGVALGANHPDNPYFGTAARLRYLAADVGPRVSESQSTFTRLLAGAKGTVAAWDYDTAFLFSQTRTKDERTGYLARNATFALLNPTAANVAAANASSAAYRALPPGSFWRIGENAGLNSPGVYAALSPQINADSRSRITQIDFKASRELGQLQGGPIGLAVGGEARREQNYKTPDTGTERGDVIGLGYSAFDASRNVYGLYAEALFPVLKTLELNAAVRADRYSDVGNSYTPKVGAKWTPLSNLAVRGTYARGFRAPGAAETGGGSAGFITAADPVRCTAGVLTACAPAQFALVTASSPGLQPEKSDSASLGVVWDVARNTNFTADIWQIKRKGEINPEPSDNLIAQGRVVRDASTAENPADPGQIQIVQGGYINSSSTTVKGLDLNARQRFDLGGSNGRITLDGTWTHLFSYKRTEPDGTVFSYAGTHGNCDVTNCIGTPKDRVSVAVAWDVGSLRLATIANYRGALKNILEEKDTACADKYADGTDAPAGCRIASFTTVDVTARYKFTQKTELFGSILNVFDKVAPLDPHTYGAIGYNPLDYRGVVGRYFSIGVRHQF